MMAKANVKPLERALMLALRHIIFRRQDTTMKTIIGLLLIALLLSTNGCMTNATVQRAKGQQLYWSDAPDNTPHPAYYAFLPLTIPLDIATCPIQGICWLALNPSKTTNHDTPTKAQ